MMKLKKRFIIKIYLYVYNEKVRTDNVILGVKKEGN